MRMRMVTAAASAGVVWVGAGCQVASPPPRGEIPPPGVYSAPERTVVHKPLPDQDDGVSAMPAGFEDAPLLTQPLPEQAAFVQAYRAVGTPRVALFVNRSTEGLPIVSDRAERIERIDYDAVENVMTDWLAAGGKVVMVSPKLSESQARDLNAQARQNVLQALGKESGIDVLVHVQAKMTRHYGGQPGLRLLAEAVNTQGGESLARAFIDMPPVMDKPIINERTRFLARKLMLDMTRFWQNAPAPVPPAETPPPQPQPQPAPQPSTPLPPPVPPSTLP